jgi:hypothetical protein
MIVCTSIGIAESRACRSCSYPMFVGSIYYERWVRIIISKDIRFV